MLGRTVVKQKTVKLQTAKRLTYSVLLKYLHAYLSVHPQPPYEISCGRVEHWDRCAQGCTGYR